MKRRQYKEPRDVELLQEFNGTAAAVTGGCGYLHPGDIPHHIFNGNKHYNPSDLLSIWEDETGVTAWVLAQPRHKAFDAQVRPDLRGSSFAADVYAFAEERTIEVIRQHEIVGDAIGFEAWRCDAATAALLETMGWNRIAAPPWTVNRISLADAPRSPLPPDYSVRSVRGVEEAAAVAAVHDSAFPGVKWTERRYRTVMESPGYAAEREFVVEASDGTFAAFTVTWHDPITKTGLFEPVGTHRDYRQRGLAKALICYAMNRMTDAGMETAIVVNHPANEAARSLYRSCGFEPWQQIDDYEKPIQN